jgi:predicted alpha/beta hydrolase family esterase
MESGYSSGLGRYGLSLLRNRRNLTVIIQMHYWRAPVPEMWIDILQKVKAAG